MAALPIVIDSQTIANGVAQASHIIVKRAVDHNVLETLAVSGTAIVGMGLLIYWGYINGGSWKK